MSTIACTIIASDADGALDRVRRHVAKVDGFSVTGQVSERSARHLLWDVEVANEGGNVNDLWVALTSYGITPDDTLGSRWQTVAGVGA